MDPRVTETDRNRVHSYVAGIVAVLSNAQTKDTVKEKKAG
jgi:hypothetical protein